MASKAALLMHDGVRRNAYKYPVKTALRDSVREITYGELNERCNRIANSLLAAGIKKGDPVALLIGNRIEHLEIVFALSKIGALSIPLDVKWRSLELAGTLSSLQPVLLFMEQSCMPEFNIAKEQRKELGPIPVVVLESEEFKAMVESANAGEPQVAVDEDDPFMVLITSGTTGFPKGCLATHRTFVSHCINNAIEKGLGAHDRALLASPLYFNHGRSYSLAMLYFGATLTMHPGFDADKILRTIEEDKITYIGAVPTMCERLLQARAAKDYDTRSLRCLAITGGKVHPTVLENLKRYITPNVYRTYASTDSGQMAISKPQDMETKPTSAGRVVWCVDLRIVDDAGAPVPVKEVGEIICKSPLATRGYYKNPEATREAFRGEWFYTGDLGYFDEEGYLFIVGRKKDMIKSGGISIYPLEIESVLYSHPDVLEAAVIGFADPEWGEAVKAVVVLKEKASTEGSDLISYCKARLAGYKVPKSVQIVESLPHTETGKVHKEKLKLSLTSESAGTGR
ncbi:MAG: class I adenylate-forming enzyme family protein [Candidatus Binatia bacterium]